MPLLIKSWISLCENIMLCQSFADLNILEHCAKMINTHYVLSEWIPFCKKRISNAFLPILFYYPSVSSLLQWVVCAWFRKIQQLFNDCIIYYVDVLLNFLKQTVLVTDWWQLTTCHFRQKHGTFSFRVIVSKFCMKEHWGKQKTIKDLFILQ